MSALMTNFDIAREAVEVSESSTGSAMREYEAWQDSIVARQQALSAQAQAFSDAILSTDLVKFVYDAGTGFLGFLTDITEQLGALPVLLSTVSGALSAFKNVGIFGSQQVDGNSQFTILGTTIEEIAKAREEGKKFTEIFHRVVEPFEGAGDVIKAFNTEFDASTKTIDDFLSSLDVSNSSLKAYLSTVKQGEATLDGYIEYVKSMSTQSKLAAAGMRTLSVAANMLTSALVGIGINLLITGLDNLFNRTEKLAEKTRELQSEYESLKQSVEDTEAEIQSNNDRIAELENISAPTLVEEGELEKLREQNELLERQLKIEEQLAELKLEDAKDSAIDTYNSMTYDSMESDYNYPGFSPVPPQQVTPVEHIYQLIDSYKKLKAEQDDLIKQQDNFDVDTKEWEKLQKQIDNVQKQIDSANTNIWDTISELKENVRDSLPDSDPLAIEIDRAFDAALELEKSGVADKIEGIFEIHPNLSPLKDELMELAEQGQLTEDALEGDKFEGLRNALSAAGVSVSDFVRYLNESVRAENLASAASNELSANLEKVAAARSSTEALASSMSTLSDAFKEQSENGSLSLDTMMQIIDAGYAAALSIDQETGAVTLNRDAFITLAQAKIQSQIASMRVLAADLTSQLSVEGQAALNDAQAFITLARAKQLSDQDIAIIGNVKELNAQIEALNNIDLSSVTAGLYNVGSAATSAANSVRQAMSEAKSAIESLVSSVVNIVKQGYQNEIDSLNAAKDAAQNRYEAEKDAAEDAWKAKQDQYDKEREALEDQLDAYEKIIDARKKALEDQRDTDDYNKELSERQKEIADLQNDIDKIANDNSAEGIKKRLELEEELAEKQSDLEEFQSDRAYDIAIDALDEELERYQDSIDAKIEMIDKQEKAAQEAHDRNMERIEAAHNAEIASYDSRIQALQNYMSQSGLLRQEAMDMITQNIQNTDLQSNALYQKLIEWNRIYGTGIDADVTTAWWEAYDAMKTYGWDTEATLNYLTTKMAEFSNTTGGAAGQMASLASQAERVKEALAGVNEGIQAALSTGGVNSVISAIGAISSGMVKYHTGTPNVDEKSFPQDFDHLYKDIKNDEVIAKLQKGEAVISKFDKSKWVNAFSGISNQNSRLMSYLNSVPSLVSGLVGSTNNYNRSSIGDSNINIAFNVQGSVDQSVLPVIKKVVKDAFDDVKNKDSFAKHTVDTLVKNSRNRGIVRNQRFNSI